MRATIQVRKEGPSDFEPIPMDSSAAPFTAISVELENVSVEGDTLKECIEQLAEILLERGLHGEYIQVLVEDMIEDEVYASHKSFVFKLYRK